MSDSRQRVIIQSVRFGPHHHPSLTEHTIRDGTGVKAFPPFVALEIAAYTGQSGYCLFHLCANGQVADTWHETIEDAVHQAEYEFGVRADEGTTAES